jgi:hypothetical protein
LFVLVDREAGEYRHRDREVLGGSGRDLAGCGGAVDLSGDERVAAADRRVGSGEHERPRRAASLALPGVPAQPSVE